MARKIYYKIPDNGKNKITDNEWEGLLRLQHWYNSEFVWTAGRLAFKMYAVFPNLDLTEFDEEEVWQQINRRRSDLRSAGLSENETILRLESEGLVIIKRGGYADECLASGFTRVAANEFNAYLVCDFLLKSSTILRQAEITALDEGSFIKSKEIKFRNGSVILPNHDESNRSFYQAMIANRHAFAIVDSAKYDHFQKFQTTISGFNRLTANEQYSILRDWNWLGFDNNFDINGDDIQGFDLNKKVVSFELESIQVNS